jgi:TldD protein
LSQKGASLRETFSGEGKYDVANKTSSLPLYSQRTPLTKDLTERMDLLREIDSYIRGKNNRVQNVAVCLAGQKKEVCIVRPDGLILSEIRPLVRMSIAVFVDDSANQTFGGRYGYSRLFEPMLWKKYAEQALRDAILCSEAKPCPAGKMDVILSNGWSGVLLHEAFGHMLEGDFKYKGTSDFADKEGKRIAAPGVTVIDQGNIPDRRGSSSFDDEGTLTRRNVLVDDGILVAYMHDRLSARILGAEPTGNGRRESYKYAPMPRMTNTFMEAGKSTPAEIIAATKHGIYVESLGGGQVDITTGKFIFTVDLAWRIENGILVEPIKGSQIVGSGGEALLSVDMIGDDLELDNGAGTCGKEGQSVPVGVGQPTVRIRKGGLTVGGTEV